MTPTNRLLASPSAPVAPVGPSGSVGPGGPVGPGSASPLEVMTDPVCVCLLDVLEQGACSESQLRAEAARRLGPTAGGPDHVARCVGVLVAAGFADASEPPPGSGPHAETVLTIAGRRSCELLDALAEAVAEVRAAGDVQQEQDLVDALETAWAARDGRRAGLRGVEEFRGSGAGRRHARRVAEGTLGQPGSPFAAR